MSVCAQTRYYRIGNGRPHSAGRAPPAGGMGPARLTPADGARRGRDCRDGQPDLCPAPLYLASGLPDSRSTSTRLFRRTIYIPRSVRVPQVTSVGSILAPAPSRDENSGCSIDLWEAFLVWHELLQPRGLLSPLSLPSLPDPAPAPVTSFTLYSCTPRLGSA